ncbi:MAG: WYL domain-containing protein [Myxococcales bacterium]|nr:WYL domain-containing protein [Myxococcales bacterium]
MSPPRREAQQTRHWRLLRLLESRRSGVTISELEEELEVSYRTIYRDLRAMEDAGLPLYQDERGDERVWRIAAQGPSTPLTPTELIGVALAGNLIEGFFEGTLFQAAIAEGLAKLRASLSEPGVEVFEAFRERYLVTASAPRRWALPMEDMARLNQGLIERRSVRIVYRSARDEESRRRVDPYHLWFREDRIYLVAYCHLREDVRTFALGRIETVGGPDQAFEVRADYDPASLGAGFGVMRGPPKEVRVRFDKAVATIVAERTWAPGQHLTWAEDGRLELTLAVSSLAEFRHWILGFGPKAEVLSPPELRRELREKLAAALARYEKDR